MFRGCFRGIIITIRSVQSSSSKDSEELKFDMYNPRKKIEPYIDRGALIDWLHQLDYGNYVIEKIRNELLINSPRV